MDSEIVIGRSSDLDMVLVEDMVSRRHARITSFHGEIGIEDFGSTNGTFVNGERVTKVRLKEGDRILVGTNIIKLVHHDGNEAHMGHLGSHNPISASGGSKPGMTQPPHHHNNASATMISTIAGFIEEVPLPDLLQLFSTSKKSGVLDILSDDTGKIFLREGRVFYATINDQKDLDPYKAFYRMMAWRRGRFSLEKASDESFENEIDESVEGLMMEGMRQLDELQNLGSDVPDIEAYLVINQPLVAPLRELKAEHLDAFQLVLNYSKVAEAMNRSLKGDLETMQDLLYLIRNDYVRVN